MDRAIALYDAVVGHSIASQLSDAGQAPLVQLVDLEQNKLPAVLQELGVDGGALRAQALEAVTEVRNRLAGLLRGDALCCASSKQTPHAHPPCLLPRAPSSSPLTTDRCVWRS